jgi:branched-subunit amino acid transport protein AzlD
MHGSLSSILRPHYMLEIAIPWLDKYPLYMTDFTFAAISDQESSPLPYRLASSCDCLVIIAKTYQVVFCLTNLWPFIILSSLNPMANFTLEIRLFVHTPLVHHLVILCIAPFDGFAKSTAPWGSSFFLTFEPSPSLPKHGCSSLKRCHRKQASPWLPCELCLTPCAGNSTAGSLLIGWQVVLLIARWRVSFPYRVAKRTEL